MTTEQSPPWDQQIAAILVRPLVNTIVTPNQITTVSLVLGLAAAALFACGEGTAAYWAAGLVIAARFIDHMDGELARQAGKGSKFGALFDSATGTASYGTLFLGMGVGEWRGDAADWVLWLAAAVALLILINMLLQFKIETRSGVAPDPYPRIGPFEVEDGIYLIGPIVWLTGTWWFFLMGTIGTLIFVTFNIYALSRELQEGE
ncbi:MAG: CDP-alcohol phosphatidyltransferase family protein [Pseudomonadota bacterium]|nr:CDP-alcohol phosphatidyltransferase family protein [Pseudomonadota bacterium]